MFHVIYIYILQTTFAKFFFTCGNLDNQNARNYTNIEVPHLLESMVLKGYNPKAIFSTKLIKGCFNLRNIRKPLGLWSLEKLGQPNVFAYNVLINVVCKMS